MRIADLKVRAGTAPPSVAGPRLMPITVDSHATRIGAYTAGASPHTEAVGEGPGKERENEQRQRSNRECLLRTRDRSVRAPQTLPVTCQTFGAPERRSCLRCACPELRLPSCGTRYRAGAIEQRPCPGRCLNSEVIAYG
jgi:hypothetical protein